jgi:hypothetical protein
MLLETQTQTFILNQKVKDDVFDVDLISQYILCLQAGSDSFRFCVVDAVFKKCLWLEDYSFPAIFGEEEMIAQLEQIYYEHQVLRAGFWKEIKLTFRNPYFTLLPTELFRPENMSDYLRLSSGLIFPRTDIRFEQHLTHHFVNVFKAEDFVVNWFRAAYPMRELTVAHQNSAFMEGVFQQKTTNTERVMTVSVERNYVTLVVSQNKQLEFCNTFSYQNEQDFVYYVMLAMDGLQLNPEECKVILHGEIVETSLIFNHLFKYVRFVSFGNRPSHLRFSYRFDEVLDHRYFDLYNIYLCQ